MKPMKRALSLVLAFVMLLPTAYAGPRASWEYDPGPDPQDAVGKKYIEIFSHIPNFKWLGESLLPKEGGKFRYAFGPTFYRGRLGKNQVKVLVIGQDGTHIAEAAGRTFTGGTGGRLQNVLHYLGVDQSYLFINTFAYTIKGQYSDYAPVIESTRNGEKVYWKQFLSPEGYALAQDPNGPIVKWRNELIDHIIDANKDSLKLIIAVGGAARDTLGTYMVSRGIKVPTIYDAERAKKVQMIAYKSAHAGGNKSFYFPVDRAGKNVLVNEGERAPRYSDTRLQDEHMKRASEAERIAKMVRQTNGPYGNGMMDLAQFGYNIDKVEVGGKLNSLKGIKLANGNRVSADIRYVALPHPGSAGGISDEQERFAQVARLEQSFQVKLDLLKKYREQGWEMEEDEGLSSLLFGGSNFRYGKKPIPRADFPFSKTQIVIDDDSSARRETPNIIEIGGRDPGQYLQLDVDRSLKAKPANDEASFIESNNVPWEPHRSNASSYDLGPASEWARLMVEKLDLRKAYETGAVKNDKNHGFVGIYRGTFQAPQAIVVADPKDLDDFFTARALTGHEGQKLHGFMSAAGFGDQYLVIKTLPFDMSGATDAEWKKVLGVTKTWRDKLVGDAITKLKPKVVFTLGKYADEVVASLGIEGSVISLTASYKDGHGKLIKLSEFEDAEFSDKPRDIPRSHLPYGMQAWVGTSGNRVVRAQGSFAGVQYQIVVPKWVTDSKVKPTSAEKKYVGEYCEQLEDLGFRTACEY